MKKISLLVIGVLVGVTAFTQDFSKDIATARSSYSSGALQDSRFAMEQMLRDLDMAIGKEILKLLPTKLGALPVVDKQDDVSGTGSYVGLYVNRHYGSDVKSGSIEIINNSPLINSLNMILNMPLVGGMMTNENQKVLKVQGYKSILNKDVNTETGKTNYQLQIPMNNTLLTVKMDDSSEGEITGVANGIALAKIVQIAQ
ncbi:MAG: hypothetical protein KBF45_14740 [Cyclobacteriaceae bacterium]|nr:hypothetical protein [Cyclobacteriaceae bacterium]